MLHFAAEDKFVPETIIVPAGMYFDATRSGSVWLRGPGGGEARDRMAGKVLLVAHSEARDNRVAALLAAKGCTLDWRCPMAGETLPRDTAAETEVEEPTAEADEAEEEAEEPKKDDAS